MSGMQATGAVNYLRSVATTRATFAAQCNREQQTEWLAADLIEQQAAEIEQCYADNQAAVRAYAKEIDEAKAEIERLRKILGDVSEKLMISGTDLAGARAEIERRDMSIEEWVYEQHVEVKRLRAALDALGVAIADAGYTWTPEMRAAYEKGKK